MVTICLLLPTNDETKRLQSILANLYNTIVAQEILPDAPFDLCIINPTMLDIYYSRLLQLKKSSTIPLPILLITARQSINSLYDQSQMVDEIISTPIEMIELNVRIRSLLRMREQSLLLYRRDNECTQSEKEHQEEIVLRKNLEKELASSKEFLEKLLNNINLCISVKKGPNLIFTYVNPSYQAVNPHVEMLGKSYYEVFPEASSQGAIDLQLNVLKTGKPWILQRFHSPVPGKPDAVWEGRVIRLDPSYEGEEPSVLTITWDITEQAIAEEETKKSRDEALRRRAELETILQLLPVGIAIYNKDGSVKEDNIAFKKIMSYSESDIHLPVEKRIATRKLFDEKGNPLPIDQFPFFHAIKGTNVQNQIIRIKKENGSEKWVIMYFSPILINNEITGVVSGTFDITEMKKTEQSLRESEEKFRAIFEQAAVGIGRVGFHDARWIDINPAFCKMLGYTPEEFKATPWPQITHHDDLDLDLIPFNQMAAGELGSYSIEKRFIHKNGYYIWARLTLSLVRDEKKRPDYEVAIIEDITERKRLETQLNQRIAELATANSELESFSYSVAHDLRNPLRTIRGFADILVEDCINKLDPECQDYVSRIKDGTVRMNSIIDDILALSKITRQEIEITDINLSDMVKKSIEELKKAQPQRHVEVTIKEGQKTHADARLISVILGNLLGNAWKYTGKIENAKIEFGSMIKNNQIIYFVKDNGVGFDMSKSAQLFTPFKRLHSDKDFKGVGVGLAIVDRAIKRHGGKIWAESSPGKGATFFFTLD